MLAACGPVFYQSQVNMHLFCRPKMSQWLWAVDCMPSGKAPPPCSDSSRPIAAPCRNRFPLLPLNAFILHAPVEGSAECEEWWAEAHRVSRLIPGQSTTICFVDANGKVGSSTSDAIGPVHPDTETFNGFLFASIVVAVRPVRT